MCTCSNCGASLKYPVFVAGVAYGADCAEALFGVRVPVGASDITSLVESAKINRAELDKQLSDGRALVVANMELLSSMVSAMIRTRDSNEWEYNFLLSIASNIGATNLTDCTDLSKYWVNPKWFDISAISPKQAKILNRIIS